MSGGTSRAGARRLAAQGLARDTDRTPVEAAAVAAGLQAQDLGAARLGIRARSATARADEVDAALTEHRTLARTTLMRGTLHLVPTSDLGWLSALFAPGLRRSFATRWRGLGLTDEIVEAAVTRLPEMLHSQPRTAAELADDLVAAGAVPAAVGNSERARAHLAIAACVTGRAVRGPDRGRTATYVSSEPWLRASPTGPTGDAAVAELARRYFRAFGPATAADFAAWSGLPGAAAVESIRDELAVAGGSARAPRFVPADAVDAPGWRGLRLLPAFDTALLGVRDRSELVPPTVESEIFAGGIVRPAIVRGGQVIGRWKLAQTRTRAAVEVWPFIALSRPTRSELEAEVADLERFYARPAGLTVHS